MLAVMILTLALLKSFSLFSLACLMTYRIVSARLVLARLVVSSFHAILIAETKAK